MSASVGHNNKKTYWLTYTSPICI